METVTYRSQYFAFQIKFVLVVEFSGKPMIVHGQNGHHEHDDGPKKKEVQILVSLMTKSIRKDRPKSERV